VLLVGGLLAPGGGFIDDGSAKSSFSVIGSAKEPVEIADMKKIVDVFHKLMRRCVSGSRARFFACELTVDLHAGTSTFRSLSRRRPSVASFST
jgi:hypothetical protein